MTWHVGYLLFTLVLAVTFGAYRTKQKGIPPVWYIATYWCLIHLGAYIVIKAIGW